MGEIFKRFFSRKCLLFTKTMKMFCNPVILFVIASASSKPPTASSRSSARKRLLRLDSDRINIENNNNEEVDGVNVVSRPKSRFGNVAFDLMLDTPETGNQKKRPEKLAALETRRKKYSKKRVQSKSDIDKKIFEAGERRKVRFYIFFPI